MIKTLKYFSLFFAFLILLSAQVPVPEVTPSLDAPDEQSETLEPAGLGCGNIF